MGMNEEAMTLLSHDRYAALAGITLDDVGEGYARASMPLTELHLNGLKTVQGGAIFTLADTAFAAAVNSHGTVAVAINVSISFITAASAGTLVAEAREIAVNRKLASCTVNVTDAAGTLIAVFQGMAYRKKETVAQAIAAHEQPSP
jgi:acyl-CoA thioesterase